jgi:hypothetical protein
MLRGPGLQRGQQRVMRLCQKAEERTRIRDAMRALVAQGGDGPALDGVSSNPPDPGTEVARHRGKSGLPRIRRFVIDS